MEHAMYEHVAAHAWEWLTMREYEAACEGERSACRWTRRSSVKLPARRRDRRAVAYCLQLLAAPLLATRGATARCPHMEMSVERRCSPMLVVVLLIKVLPAKPDVVIAPPLAKVRLLSSGRTRRLRC
ncbi:hypothetical protein Dimus_033734 [Dionaea muscipula]